MGLITHAAAAGIGYALGHPQGRQQLLKLRDRASSMLRRPQVVQLRERGRELVAEKTSAAVGAVNDKLHNTTTTTPAGPATPVSAAAPADESHTLSRHQRPENTTAAQQTRTEDAPTGFGGTSIEEDSRAVILGIDPLPRSTDTTPQ